MITRKTEMAEWVLDFFRKSQIGAGQVIMLRSVQNKLHELNPKERDLFVLVLNELVENGYFTYEEGEFQVLRLTQKGKDYIYNPSAVLDCCSDKPKFTAAQEKYIQAWHDSFVRYITDLRRVIEGLMLLPATTEADRRGLSLCASILYDKIVSEVERELSERSISSVLLDRIEKLEKDLIDVAVEIIQTDAIFKELLKRMAYLRIEQDKQGAVLRLSLLNISVSK